MPDALAPIATPQAETKPALNRRYTRLLLRLQQLEKNGREMVVVNLNTGELWALPGKAEQWGKPE